MRPFAVLASLLPLLAGCGNGDVEAPRVQLERFSFDPPLPADVRAVAMAGPDEGRSFPLVGAGSVREVAGAPDGPYRVEGPEGWWMVMLGARPLELRSGAPPSRVTLGRSRSVYVGAMAPTVRPSASWGAVRILEDGRRESVPVEVLADEAGYVVCLRFTPEAWRGELELIGHVALGPPEASPAIGPASPLTDPIRFQPPPDGRPLATSLRQAASAPLDVVLVAASPAVTIDGLRVHVTVSGVPFDVTLAATCRGGAAHLASVPALDRDLLLRLGDGELTHRLDPDRRRTNATTRLLVVGELPLRRVRVGVGAGTIVEQVQVRPGAAVAFGLVPFEREGDDVVFQAPRGPFRALLRAGTQWAEIGGDGDDDVRVPHAGFEREVTIAGIVHAAAPGTVVRLFRQRGNEAVLGDGFELRIVSGGAFQGGLPAGTYLVEVAGAGGEWRRPAPLIADVPGSRHHLPLDPP